jgi:hypothetical protein
MTRCTSDHAEHQTLDGGITPPRRNKVSYYAFILSHPAALFPLHSSPPNDRLMLNVG